VFFNQGDWSSDVCSSDLHIREAERRLSSFGIVTEPQVPR
jgi:hypothetical protein